MTYLMGEYGAVPKAPKRIVDKAHSDFLHTLPCCLTGTRQQIIQHHILRAPSRKGGRAGDNHSLPMSDVLHKILHDKEGNELRFFAKYGIKDPVRLAERLYENTGDYAACIQILEERV